MQIDSLVTFDPHKFFGSTFKLEGTNIGTALNFFQRNPKKFLTNPFRGRSVVSGNISVVNRNLTGTSANHINIISFVDSPLSPYRGELRDALAP